MTKRFPLKCLFRCVLLLLSLGACTPAFADTFTIAPGACAGRTVTSGATSVTCTAIQDAFNSAGYFASGTLNGPVTGSNPPGIFTIGASAIELPSCSPAAGISCGSSSGTSFDVVYNFEGLGVSSGMARFTFAANGIISGPTNSQSAQFEVVPGESLSVNGVPLVGSITAQLTSGITTLTVDTPITNGTSTLHFSMVVGAACFGEGGCVSDVSFVDPITITGASAFDASGNLIPGATFVSESGFNPNAQSVAPGLYDDFSGGFINPSKWTVSPICGGNAYDCAREVRTGHLRLAVRGYGDQNSDSGTSFAASQVMFRTPNAIDSIQLHLKVRSFSSSACLTNSDAAHPQFLISGTFFNTGTGDPTGDVSGFLMVERRTDDTFDAPGLLRVGGFMSLNGQFFNNVDLGTLQVGEAARATLRWDRTNHALVVRIVKSVTTPSIVEQSMPYALPDSQSPFVAVKSIQAGSFAPNCTSQQSFAAMDANIDNVRVNMGP